MAQFVRDTVHEIDHPWSRVLQGNRIAIDIFHGASIVFFVSPHLVSLQNIVEVFNKNFTSLIPVNDLPDSFELQLWNQTPLIFFLFYDEMYFTHQTLAFKFVQVALFIFIKTIVKIFNKIGPLFVELVDLLLNLLLIVWVEYSEQ